MIRATIHSDDYAAKADFDATPWLTTATDSQIEQLMKCDFGGDYAADAVAHWTRDGRVAGVLRYAELAGTGFECHVDADAAEAWIAKHRPHLVNRPRPAIVLAGNIFDGFKFYGPFADFDEAATWAESPDGPGCETLIATLEQPHGITAETSRY